MAQKGVEVITESNIHINSREMPSNYVRKTNKGKWSIENMKRAVKAVKQGTGIRKAARLYDVPYEEEFVNIQDAHDENNQYRDELREDMRTPTNVDVAPEPIAGPSGHSKDRKRNFENNDESDSSESLEAFVDSEDTDDQDKSLRLKNDSVARVSELMKLPVAKIQQRSTKANKGHSQIFTSTPNKTVLEVKEEKKKMKKTQADLLQIRRATRTITKHSPATKANIKNKKAVKEQENKAVDEQEEVKKRG
ncbi:hypothetical protein RN001_003679 [Aquatica leii]|uniref:HTH psq-type domain-containing protein n=1 Tax=Aquatica leii TaxID=1421715 RepID=A0AAN7PIY1_9COLE|nr:hypothetical protein RN001_003679 [Aquatica leii]